MTDATLVDTHSCASAGVAASGAQPALVRSPSGASVASVGASGPPASQLILVDDEALSTHHPSLHAFVSQREHGVLSASEVRALSSSSLRWCAPFHLLATFAVMGIKPVHAAKCAYHVMAHATRLQRKLDTRQTQEEQNDDGAPVVTSLPVTNSDSTANTAVESTEEEDVIWVPLAFGLTPLPARSCVILTQSAFTSLVHAALARCVKHSTAHHQALFGMCREITEKRRTIVILLAGTSGTGKSTLASLLAERLRISSVVSTDSIRHTLRGQYSRDQCPFLHVSTYETDQLYNGGAPVSAPLTPSSATHDASSAASRPLPAAASSTASTAASSSSSSSSPPPSLLSSHAPSSPPDHSSSWSLKKKVLHGYKQQSELVLRHLSGLLHSCAASNETVIVEGVHLLPKAVVEYMLHLPGCIPFFIFISNESKHCERFAVRSRLRTLDPQHNKYISSFANIRIIQKYLVSKAERLLIPCIDNTNVDRSVAAIHSVLLRCMRHLAAGKSLFDPASHRAVLMHEEFSHSQQDAWSSKRMQQVIRMKVEKKELFQRLWAHSHRQRQQTPLEHTQHHAPPPPATSTLTAAPTAAAATEHVGTPPPASSPRLEAVSVDAMAHSPLVHSPPRTRSPTQLPHDELDGECEACEGGRSRSMSVSFRRASVSVSAASHQPHDEEFDFFHTGSPPITSRSLRDRACTLPLPSTIAAAEAIPLPLPVEPKQPRTVRVPIEVDSEEDTPQPSDGDGDGVSSGTELDGCETESQNGPGGLSRRRLPRADAVSHATPSLYSFDEAYGDGDGEGAGDAEEEEHEQDDRNMAAAILFEEDEEEEDDGDEPEDEETRTVREHTAHAQASSLHPRRMAVATATLRVA